jgi:hypothetical protein
MAFFDDNSFSDSGQNQLNADNQDAYSQTTSIPSGQFNLSWSHNHFRASRGKLRDGINMDFIKSILSFHRCKIINKKIIANDIKSSMIKPLGTDNIGIVASFLKVPKNSREYREINDRVAKGCECYALIEESMLALTWVFRNKYRVSGGSKILNIRPDEALIAETALGESVDDSKAIKLEDGVSLLLKQRGIKPLRFAHLGNNDTPVYSLYQIRFIGFKFTLIRTNPALSPLGFR